MDKSPGASIDGSPQIRSVYLAHRGEGMGLRPVRRISTRELNHAWTVSRGPTDRHPFIGVAAHSAAVSVRLNARRRHDGMSEVPRLAERLVGPETSEIGVGHRADDPHVVSLADLTEAF